MKTLTFALDVELNDTHYIPEGTKVEIVEGIKTLNGFTAVLVNEAKSYEYETTAHYYAGQVEYFTNETFKELR